MSLARNLCEMERSREAYWLKYPTTSPLKLRRRALTVRHCFHVLPGESILELGAGSGLWTEHLTAVLRGENPITAAVFNDDLSERACQRSLPNTKFVRVTDLETDLPPESFNYVVGTAILCHDQYAHNLRALYRLLKPGGQLLFFEANYWNPQVLIKNAIPTIGRWAGNPRCHIGLRLPHGKRTCCGSRSKSSHCSPSRSGSTSRSTGGVVITRLANFRIGRRRK